MFQILMRKKQSFLNCFKLGVPTFQIDELAEDVVGNSREGVGAQIQYQHCVRQVVDQGLVWEKITRELRYWQQWPQIPQNHG